MSGVLFNLLDRLLCSRIRSLSQTEYICPILFDKLFTTCNALFKVIIIVITLLSCNLKLTNHKSHMSKTVQDIVKQISYQLEILFSMEF